MIACCIDCGVEDTFRTPAARCLACARAWRAADDADAEAEEALAAIEPWDVRAASVAEEIAFAREMQAPAADALAQGGAA